MDRLDSMKPESGAHRRARQLRVGSRVGALAALVTLTFTLALWLLRPVADEPPAGNTALPRRPELISALAAPTRVEPSTAPGDEIPLMQAGSEDSSAEGPRRPHPITPTRLRIYRENNLIGALNQAMDLGRHQALRELNAQYREDYPEDEHGLQQAYDLIADCQQELTDERQTRAREFWKKHRSSQLRRFVRRHCRL
jgi:hypothetical protein